MSDERVIFPDFRNELGDTRYPFGDDASLMARDGLQLNLDTFIDATIFAVGNAGRAYLSNVNVAANAITLSVSDSTGRLLCTGQFNPLLPPYNIGLTDPAGRAAGLLVSEPLRLAIFTTWSLGDHPFDLGTTEFAASVVIPTPEVGVRGIATVDGEVLSGDIWLIGDNGVIIRDDGDGHIRIDVVGDPLFRRKLCTPQNLFTPPRFIKTVNGCPPDAFGNWQITTGGHLANDNVLRVLPVEDGLQIEAVGRLTQTSP